MAHNENRLKKITKSDVCPQSVARRARFGICVVLATVITMAFSVQAHAQSASFRSVDTNRDGVLSYDELVTQFGQAGADRLLQQLDRNGDNILTIHELRQQDDNDDNEDRSTRSEDDDDGRDNDNEDDGDDTGPSSGGGGGGDDGDDDDDDDDEGDDDNDDDND